MSKEFGPPEHQSQTLSDFEASLWDVNPPPFLKLASRRADENYLVFDTETKLVERGTNIFVDRPEFILGVSKHGSAGSPNMSPTVTTSRSALLRELESSDTIDPRLYRSTRRDITWVGHNIGFDLITVAWYALPNLLSRPNIFLWDTAVAEYMIRGQSMKYPSLKDSLSNWPGKVTATKDDAVGDAIRNGICPSTMDKERLAKYCSDDVEATAQLFLAQAAYLYGLPYLYKAVLNRMEWLKNTLIASAFGMQLDTSGILEAVTHMSEEGERLKAELTTIMQDDLRWAKDEAFKKHPDALSINIECNPNSFQHAARFLYGGIDIEYVATVETGEVYKTGPRKGYSKLKNILGTVPARKATRGVGSCIGVSEADLKLFKMLTKDPVKLAFVDKLLEYRDLEKTRKTYFAGYAKYADPVGRIHPVYNLTATPSGRLTCNKPNAQNMK